MREPIVQIVGTVFSIASGALAVYHALLNDRYEAMFFFLVALIALLGSIAAHGAPNSKFTMLFSTLSSTKRWVLGFLISSVFLGVTAVLFNKSYSHKESNPLLLQLQLRPAAPSATPTPPSTPTPLTRSGVRYPIKVLHEMMMEDAVWFVDGIKTAPADSSLPSFTVLMLTKGHHTILAKAGGEACDVDITVPVSEQGVTLKCHSE